MIAFIEVPFSYVGPKETGNDLYEHVLPKASWLLDHGERSGLLVALRAWLADRRHPRTWLATELAGALELSELRPELIALRADISAGRAFLAHDVQWVDRALLELDAPPEVSA